MNKAANIYWDSSPAGYTVSRRSATARHRRSAAKAEARSTPWWVSYLIVTSIFVMLCVSINFRAFTEMREEADKNTHLSGRIQSLMDENLALQEEIHLLKTDPLVIKRAADRIGINFRQEQVPVPAN